ncbi:hypothetical protein [Effusibacillus consociatus]|uniref:hypothetical protein n=1 Tax=Effusibacillus consociatus TaxID=1117041 RepID=UPI0036D226F2
MNTAVQEVVNLTDNQEISYPAENRQVTEGYQVDIEAGDYLNPITQEAREPAEAGAELRTCCQHRIYGEFQTRPIKRKYPRRLSHWPPWVV